MKGSALASSLVLVPLFASACASPRSLPGMPAWAPDSVQPVVASAYPVVDDDEDDEDDEMRMLERDIDDEGMRMPRNEEVPEIWPAQGLYIGGALITSQPMGDFDSDLALEGPTDLVLIPDLDVGAGGGLYLSYRWHMNELMVQYSITEHDGSFSGSPRDHDTTFYDLDFNWRHYFMPHSALQPYGLLGIGWASAEIDNGSTDQATGTIFQDAELKNGINFNVGIGAALYTLPWVSFWGQAMYRFVRWPKSSGIDGNFENDPDVDGDGWNISFGAALRLLPSRN
jgi:opacity protein-like surface antigen